MSSIAAAANKIRGERRLSDQVRLQTGHMLTFDDFTHREGVTEKHVLHRVLEKRIITNAQLMTLPLSLMYFAFYVAAYYMHEDISNVFFVESTIRLHADNMFAHVTTIDELWEQIEGPFVDTFFKQRDYEGNLVNKSLEDMDRWGLWGRVGTYNQIQGAVRFMSTRKDLSEYGVTPWMCNSERSCELCRANTGFMAGKITGSTGHDCGLWGCNGTTCSSTTRRLAIYRPELVGTMEDPSPDEDEHFVFYVYPGEDLARIKDSLRYFRERGWLDHNTTNMHIQFYLVNCELGRCRLEQVQLMFRFSQGGGIYYKRLLIPIFLELFAGARNMMCDGAFFLVWLCTSCFRIFLAWRAFLHSELFNHMVNPLNLFEIAVVLAGLMVGGVVGLFFLIARSCRQVLEPVRELGWAINSSNEDIIREMFTTITGWASMLENARMVGNFFALVLMFRFFINFGAQARLHVVTRSLAVVLNDLGHFGLVFIPILLAYMCSGTIMFGRNFFEFTTVKAAMGSSFRIMMEGEYEWAAWTEEYYWYTGLWTWIFMFMIVLVMLNMTLAIILDVYNEVRETTNAKNAETIVQTVVNVFLRIWAGRSWVTDRRLLKAVLKAPQLQGSIITKNDIRKLFPMIANAQLRILFTDCRREMEAEAARDLDNKTLLQTAGALMNNLDKQNALMKQINGVDDPIHEWTTPHLAKTSATMAGETHDTFMTLTFHSKGAKNPHLVDPDQPRAEEEKVEGERLSASDPRETRLRTMPPWLADVYEVLDAQKKWLSHAQWQLQQIEWQMYVGHMTNYNSGKEDVL